VPSWPLRSRTQLEVLRYDGFCCPRRSSLLFPPPTSAQRSTTSRITLIGFTATGAPDGGTLRACVAGVETDLSCSTMGCVIVPLPLRRRVSGAAHPRSSHRSWPSPVGAGLGTRMSPAGAGWVHDADTGFLAYGPITCSPPMATLSWRFDSRISPSASHQLRGRLAATPTGLPPASPSQLDRTHPTPAPRGAIADKQAESPCPAGGVLRVVDHATADNHSIIAEPTSVDRLTSSHPAPRPAVLWVTSDKLETLRHTLRMAKTHREYRH
jgi:hypothetical protein